MIPVDVTLAGNKDSVIIKLSLDMSFVPYIMNALYLDAEAPYFYDWDGDKGRAFVEYWRDKSE